jgi:lipopolysaccharide transport system permease protein
MTDEVLIEPGRFERQYWRDLWRYRELFYFLAWRDLLVRYRQTIAGVAWSVIRPLFTIAVLTVVFGRLGKMPSGGVPYPMLVLCGILPWQFFSAAMAESGNSLLSNSNLISKVYFPRLVVPASSVIASLVDFVIALGLGGAIAAWYRFAPSPHVVALPLFVLLCFVAAMGGGLLISAAMVRFRDLRFVVPFVVQLGLYVSPVGFPSYVVPARWRVLYSLNPIVGVIDGFRWSILGGEHALFWPGMIASTSSALALLAGGLWFFRWTERTFADVI